MRIIFFITLIIACAIGPPSRAQAPVTTTPLAWTPNGNTEYISATTSSSRVQFGWALLNPVPNPPPALAWVCNTGADNAYVRIGNSSVVAASTDTPVLAGACVQLAIRGNQYVAGLAAVTATTISVQGGDGSPVAFGTGSSGGTGGPFMTTPGTNATAGALQALATSAGTNPLTVGGALTLTGVPIGSNSLRTTGQILSTAGTVGTPLGLIYGYALNSATVYANNPAGVDDPITSAFFGQSHLSAGSRGVAVGLIGEAFNDGTWTPGGVNGGSAGVEGYATSSRGGDTYGLYGRSEANTTTGALVTGIEGDVIASAATVDTKYGMAINSVVGDTATVTGTQTVAGSGATVSNSVGYLLQSQGNGFHYGLMMIEQAAGLPPVDSTGTLWRAGGYTVADIIDAHDLTCSGICFDVSGGVALRSSVGVTGGTTQDFIALKNTSAGDASVLRLAQRDYTDRDQTSIDFIANSLSNFQSSISFKVNNGSANVEALSLNSDLSGKFAGAVLAPGLASSSAATTGTLCWTTGTGNVNVNTSGACGLTMAAAASSMSAINNTSALGGL